MRRSRRIPLPLLAVLLVVLVEGLAWTFMVPALQGADEGAHFSYVQQIADGPGIPWGKDNFGHLERDYPPSVSGEQRLAWRWAGLEPLRGNQAARPLWTDADEAIWRARADQLSDYYKTDAIGSSAWRNPPLYYLSAAVPYEIAGGSFFDRLFALRLYNLVLLLGIVALTWLLAGELFGPRRALQTVASGAVALHPTLLDTMTRVTPDALLTLIAAAVLYLMAVILRRGPQWRMVALLGVLLVAGGFTQPRALSLVVPAGLAIGLAWWRRRERAALAGPGAAAAPGRRAAWILAALAVAVAGVAFVALSLYATRIRVADVPGFWSYLWQFYLPALPGMAPPLGPEWGVHQVYLDRFFATFVQFEVGFPQDLRDLLRVAIWAGLALLALAAVRRRAALRERRDLVVVLVVTFVLTILALHAAAFREVLLNPVDPILTGRYLLMLIPLFGLAVAAATTALPAGRVRAAATGALLGGAVLLQLAAFGEVLARFYA